MPDDLLAPVEREEALPAITPARPLSEAATLMEVIGRAASDPATDVDKLERLMGLYERIKAGHAKAAYTAALAEMQPELPEIVERGEIRISENKPGQKYARWEDINEAIKPILAKHGFALSFKTGRQDEKVVVTGILSHRAGHSEETTLWLPADNSGSKNAVQAIGSSTSYGKRYTAGALLNLTSRGEDDDGWGGGTKLITAAQCDTLNLLADEVGADKIAYCKYLGVESIAAIPAHQFARAKQALQAKATRK